ncbi:MAG: hypothetical protein WCW01_01265 [Gammaproteobacteria bacterium]
MTYSITYKPPFNEVVIAPPQEDKKNYAFWDWRTKLESALATEDKMDRQAANISSSFALAGTALAVTFGIAHTVLANVAPDNKTSSTIIGAVETGLGAILAGISLYLRNLYNPNNPNDNSFKMRQQTLFDMLQAGVRNSYLSFETAQGIAGIYLPNKSLTPSLSAVSSTMFSAAPTTTTTAPSENTPLITGATTGPQPPSITTTNSM